MRHLLFIIIPIFTLLSCKRPQSTYSSKETVRTDTFFRYREVIKTLPQKDSVVIFNPCDSLGIINRFYAQISIPDGKVEIQGKDNKIMATVRSNGAVSVMDSVQVRSVKKDSSVVEKVVVKTIIPTWIIVTLFIETMIILLYLYYRLTFYK
jgi:hypothetical protein